MFGVDLCIRIHGYHQLSFHQLVNDHRPNGLCDSLRMGQMVLPKLFLKIRLSGNGFFFTIFANFNEKGIVLGSDSIFLISKMTSFGQNYLCWSI